MKIKECIGVRTWLSSALAGVLIGIGGTVYFSCESRMLGAFMFAVGLFSISLFGLDLFTGRCGYLLESKPRWMFGIKLLVVWAGNFVGAGLMGWIMGGIRPAIQEIAASTWAAKQAQTVPETLFLAVMCGMLIYIAVECIRRHDGGLVKYLGVFTTIPVFIFCGFEHCVADMFYMIAAGEFDIVYILLVSVGNVLGGLILPLFRLLPETAKP